MKRILVMLVACALMLSVIPAAFAEENVKIVYAYNSNGMQSDTALVQETMNAWLKNQPGCENITIELQPIANKGLASAITLAQASGEQIDMCNSYGISLGDYVADGYCIALDDMLANTDIPAELPAWLLELGKYNGNTYFIPNFQNPATMKYLTVPTEYLKYYEGGAEAIRDILLNPETTVAEKMDIRRELVLAVREGTGIDTKWIAGEMYPDHNIYIDRLVSRIVVVLEGQTVATNLYTNEDYRAMLAAMADWYAEGIVHPDNAILNASDFTGKNFLNEASGVVVDGQSMSVAADETDKIITMMSGDVEMTYIPQMDHYFTNYTWAAGGNWITSTCKNPEAAMKIIELLNTQKGIEFFNLLVYGIEGRQYEKNEDGTIKTLEFDGTQGGASTTFMTPGWMVGNTSNQYLNQGFPANYVGLINSIGQSERTAHSLISGILFNNTAVADEIAQLQAVETEYWKTITTGVAGENFDAVYEEFLAKLDAAGIQKVLDHINAQIEANLN